MLLTRMTIAGMTMLLATMFAASAAEAQPPQTTVVHAIAGQGKVAVSWNAVASATLYQVWVADYEGWKVYNLFTPANAGCPSNTGVCSVFASVTVVPGPFQAMVASWNAGGYSPWSPPYDAMAEASMPRVVDQNNKFVGTLIDPQRIFFTLNGRITETPIIKQRIYLSNPPSGVLYTTNNCSGTRYMMAAVPDRLQFNNSLTTGWLLSGASSQITVESSGSIDPVTNLPVGCNDESPYSETVQQLTQFNGTTLFGSLVNPLKVVQ